VAVVRYLRKMINCDCRDLADDMPARRYQIIVSGRLGMAGCEAFRDLQIEPHGTDTVLTGDLNRPALYDVLARIRDLALDLAGLTCLAPGLMVQTSANLRTRRGRVIDADRDPGW
jgi:hypothetical protein